MAKGQTIVLRQAGVPLSVVRVQASWEAARRRGLFRSRTLDIDLDLSVVLFADRQPVDVVFFRHLVSDDGSVRHTGDAITSSVNDESVLVDLQRVPAHIDSLVMTLNSFTGQTYNDVAHVQLRLVDQSTGRDVARYGLAGGGTYAAQVLAKLSRQGDDWTMTALGTPANGRTFQDLMPAILPLL
ncbi:TerD family protein [Streptomyces sp. NPDC050997]|uniref:TerD family protein n=1 Tax=Streptomyces sp. NPDC050997 TaxID=3155519 RepID=UPI00343C9BC2